VSELLKASPPPPLRPQGTPLVCDMCGSTVRELNVASEALCRSCINTTMKARPVGNRFAVALLIVVVIALILIAMHSCSAAVATRPSIDSPPSSVGLKSSIFGFNWNEQPKDLTVNWLPQAFDQGSVLYHIESGRVVGVTLLSTKINIAREGSNSGAMGKMIFEEATKRIEAMNHLEPWTEENDGGQGAAFYSCLALQNPGSELAYSVCNWKAWWGESPFTVEGYFPDSSDSQVVVSIESSQKISVSIGNSVRGNIVSSSSEAVVSRRLRVAP
jgi:hypothetical protein